MNTDIISEYNILFIWREEEIRHGVQVLPVWGGDSLTTGEGENRQVNLSQVRVKVSNG